MLLPMIPVLSGPAACGSARSMYGLSVVRQEVGVRVALAAAVARVAPRRVLVHPRLLAVVHRDHDGAGVARGVQLVQRLVHAPLAGVAGGRVEHVLPVVHVEDGIRLAPTTRSPAAGRSTPAACAPAAAWRTPCPARRPSAVAVEAAAAPSRDRCQRADRAVYVAAPVRHGERAVALAACPACPSPPSPTTPRVNLNSTAPRTLREGDDVLAIPRRQPVGGVRRVPAVEAAGHVDLRRRAGGNPRSRMVSCAPAGDAPSRMSAPDARERACGAAWPCVATPSTAQSAKADFANFHAANSFAPGGGAAHSAADHVRRSTLTARGGCGSPARRRAPSRCAASSRRPPRCWRMATGSGLSRQSAPGPSA